MYPENEILAKITSRPWLKNWMGKEGIFTGHYFGYQYTKFLKQRVGISMRESLLIFHRGVASSYFINEHKNNFSQFFFSKLQKEPQLLQVWTTELKQWTDKLVSASRIFQSEDTISRETFFRLVEVMNEYYIYHRIVKLIADSLSAADHAKEMQLLSDARKYCEPALDEYEKAITALAKRISTKENVPSEFVLALTAKQLEAYFSDGSLPDTAVMKAQFENFILYSSEEDDISTSEPTVVLKIEKDIEAMHSSTTLKGTIAFRGKVRGVARVILAPSASHHFDVGEILVSGTTRPDYLPFIQKAAAIVTDAGGTLSHAAISARELHKPCIVGTEVATKKIHDGDMVEVDAEKGVVTILERAA